MDIIFEIYYALIIIYDKMKGGNMRAYANGKWITVQCGTCKFHKGCVMKSKNQSCGFWELNSIKR